MMYSYKPVHLVFVYRHSKEMIQCLENAGLGFYVKSTKTVHKLGK